MMQYIFTVREKPVPYSHWLGWVAVDSSNNDEVPLPNGGTGDYLGSFPEIEAYMLAVYGIATTLAYDRGRDELEIEHGISAVWTFKTQGHEIIVRDIPRTILRFTAQR